VAKPACTAARRSQRRRLGRAAPPVPETPAREQRTRLRLVDAVVHHLGHQVVQAALAGGANMHAGALAHRLQALQHRDLTRHTRPHAAASSASSPRRR
jgi:hypothetical protein